MRVTLERSNLLKSLGHVHRVVERRNTIPILSNVLLRAEGNGLHLKATDLDLEIIETVPAMVEQGGSTTVPAHMLFDIVRKLPDGSEVALDTAGDGSQLSISAGHSRFTLQILPESDFPNITVGEFSHQFKINHADLGRLIHRTQFAISNEETRYYLNGIFMHTLDVEGKTRLRAVATDGHRLARADVAAPAGAEGMPGVIVPRKAVGEILKLTEESDDDLSVEFSDSKIRVSVGDIVLTSKLIDGTFPDYERVIPSGNDKDLIVDRSLFKEAVDRVSTISSERGRAVKLAISDGVMVLTVNNPDSGTATEEVAVDYQAEAVEVGFNSRYLLDISNQLTSSEAHFRMADATSPTIIADRGEEDTLYVIMPMRV